MKTTALLMLVLLSGCVSFREKYLEAHGMYLAPAIVENIEAGQIVQGMTTQQVMASWELDGVHAYNSSRHVMGIDGVIETWIIPGGYRLSPRWALRFRNNCLVSWTKYNR